MADITVVVNDQNRSVRPIWPFFARHGAAFLPTRIIARDPSIRLAEQIVKNPMAEDDQPVPWLPAKFLNRGEDVARAVVDAIGDRVQNGEKVGRGEVVAGVVDDLFPDAREMCTSKELIDVTPLDRACQVWDWSRWNRHDIPHGQ